MKKTFYMLLILLGCAGCGGTMGRVQPDHGGSAGSETKPLRDLMSDTWVATDGANRTLGGFEQCGPVRKDKFVGIFYFNWFGPHGYDVNTNQANAEQGVLPKTKQHYDSPYDITKLLAENPDNPQFGPNHAFHYWGEPELGYYLSDDEFVIRRHCQMLVDAGIDVIILDATNGYTYTKVYMNLLRIYQEIRDAGGRTPQIAFMAHTKSETTVPKIYNELYAENLYPDLWFYWKGKPLMLTPPEGLSREVLDFFTIRYCWAWSKVEGYPDWFFGDGKDAWTYMDYLPQAYGWSESPDKPEQVSVVPAMHAHMNMGKSFKDGKQPEYNQYDLPKDGTSGQGIYCADQWKRALEVDPEFILLVDWNGWAAMRFEYPDASSGDWNKMLGRELEEGESFFVDSYNAEYNRELEPMKGGYGDNYYFQMAANIRKFKGVRPVPSAGAAKTISIDGRFDDWTDVSAEYFDTMGDVTHRNHPGWGSAGPYINTTGRNDILSCKVARDDENIYFYVVTSEPVTGYQDKNWMRLFIDIDANLDTGWEGYDFLINDEVIDDNTTTLKQFSTSGRYAHSADIHYQVSGNQMELSVPRKLLGVDGKSNVVLDFHWADNIQKLYDITEFALNGDSAPNRRFKYRYKAAE